MEPHITFCSGCPVSHSKRLAELIDSTDPGLHRFLFAATGDPLRAIELLAAAGKGLFSHRLVHAALSGAELVGACVSFKPDAYAGVLAESVDVVRDAFGPGQARALDEALQQLMTITPPFPPSSLFVQNLAVASTHHRLGIGRMLLSKTLQQAAASGLKVCALDVCSENESAMAFYRSLGGRVDSAWSARGIGLLHYVRVHIPLTVLLKHPPNP